MIAAPLPRNETRRLATLRSTGLLGTPDQYSLDCITNIGARLFGVPVCTISLVDESQQWFKSRVGLELTHVPRNISFCAHVVATALSLVVEDTLRDVRFADSPLVTDAPRIRFYAGFPLQAANGEVLGTLCIIDSKPRAFPGSQLRLLRELALMAQLALSDRNTESPLARGETLLDPRLGTWNRAGITAILDQHISDASSPCAVAMISINHLEAITAQHGAATSELLLKAVVRELRSLMRPTQQLGHYCNARLLAVLPRAGETAAEHFADLMRDAITLLSVDIARSDQIQQATLGCSVSIGVATRQPTPADSARKMIQRANAALSG